jgi:hypothetical protein
LYLLGDFRAISADGQELFFHLVNVLPVCAQPVGHRGGSSKELAGNTWSPKMSSAVKRRKPAAAKAKKDKPEKKEKTDEKRKDACSLPP